MNSKIIHIVITGIVGIILIGAVIIVVPKLMQKQQSQTGLSSAASGQAKSTAVNKELLAILQNVNSISLNDAVLKDPVFQSLVDISIAINRSHTEGRINPFSDLTSFGTPITTATNLLPSSPTVTQ